VFAKKQQGHHCNDPLEGGHILAHFKVEVIKQPLYPVKYKNLFPRVGNKFDKIFVQIQSGLNSPKPNAH